MHVLYLTPELAPYSQTCELGEVAAALPRALHELGVKVTVLTPFHRSVQPDRFGLTRRLRKVSVPLGAENAEVGIVDGKFLDCDLPVIFIDHPASFDRDGIHQDPSGAAYPDEHRRNYLLARAALAIALELKLEVDLFHVNGWQGGFLPLLLRTGAVPALRETKRVLALQDASESGLYDPAILDELRLGYELYNLDGIEFHGKVSLLKAAILYSDAVTMPSESFASEVARDEEGGRFAGVFRALGPKLFGILPGVDAGWSPTADHRIAERYSAESLAGKEACKRALLAELNLPARRELPLLLLADLGSPESVGEALQAADPLLRQSKLQLVLIGAAARHPAGQGLAAELPDRVALAPAAGDGVELRRGLAGADAILLATRRPASALLALKAQRYGAIPIANAVGGLREVLCDYDPRSRTGTAICCTSHASDAIATGLQRLIATHADAERWGALTVNALRQDRPWSLTGRRTLELYRGLLGNR
jgi:starch synthase